MSGLARAVSWIDRRLDLVRVDHKTTPDNAYLASIKAIAELAHAGDTLTRGGDPGRAAIGARWLETAWSELDGGEALAELIRRDPMFALTAVGFLPFALAGRRCAALEAALAEQTPRVEMAALGWALLVPSLEILGVAAPTGAVERARTASVLAGRPAPDRMATDAVYLFAHECLYASRWGRRPAPFDAELAAYVDAALAQLAGRYAAAGDADVVAELILAGHSLGRVCAAPEIWSALDDTQTGDGNLVAPPLSDIRRARLPHPRLGRTYHTTIAAIMAWSMCRH
jgi:hypothetical protein